MGFCNAEGLSRSGWAERIGGGARLTRRIGPVDRDDGRDWPPVARGPALSIGWLDLLLALSSDETGSMSFGHDGGRGRPSSTLMLSLTRATMELPPGPDLPGHRVAQLWIEQPVEF